MRLVTLEEGKLVVEKKKAGSEKFCMMMDVEKKKSASKNYT